METILDPVFYPKDAVVPSAQDLAARDSIVLTVGRLVPEKDFITLVRAFARVKSPGARLVILGKGPEQHRIEGEIKQLKPQDRMHLLGYMKEPWAIYGAAKCFVSSSTSESFGNVVVEAKAFGLPIEATACSGPHQSLEHGTYGRIVGIGNHVKLANAIDATLTAPGDPAQRRSRAEVFSFDSRVPAYEDLVRDVLEESDNRIPAQHRPSPNTKATQEQGQP
jgi:glycosyltransferase involved in cell wall biosynthesis